MIRSRSRGSPARRIRACLTALAVVLGVAMVSGTFVLTDTIAEGVHQRLRRAPTRTRRHRQRQAGRRRLRRRTRPCRPSLLEQVRSLPGVAAAAGSARLDTPAIARRRHGDRSAATARAIGFGIDPPQPRVQPDRADRGQLGRGPAARS